MFKSSRFVFVVAISAGVLSACADVMDDDGDGDGRGTSARARDHALSMLETLAAAPITLETGATMTPGFHVAGRSPDIAEAAQRFLAENHAVFQLSASDASSFVVTRLDVDRDTEVRHVTLQRVYQGIPVFQGAITVHMDRLNAVFRVLGDEFYRITPPVNRQVLTPAEAVIAAGGRLGLGKLTPTIVSDDGRETILRAAHLLDPVHVAPQIYQAASGDSRFAYQATMSWRDGQNQLQYQLVLVDAQDGGLLASHSLVNTFGGRVFKSSPGANPSGDARVLT